MLSAFTRAPINKPDERPFGPRVMGTTRAGRLVVVGIMMTVLVFAMLIQAKPLPQISVDQMVDEATIHENNQVHVRGTVKPNTVSDEGNTFTLSGEDSDVHIDASGISLPEGLIEGTTVAVEGKLKATENGWTIKATQVQTGCPSKYETTNE